jgi:PEP-CTERM motif
MFCAPRLTALASRAIVTAMVLSSLGSAAYAAPVSLVTNGDFTASTYTSNSQFGSGSSQQGQGVTGWTGNNGYDLYFTSAAAASTVNAAGQYSYTGKEKLYGPVANSPTGGAFVALDGDSALTSTISQSISGLTVGSQYKLDFDWGAAQAQSRSGATTESFAVSLGNQTFTTKSVANPSRSFTGWMHQTFTYTATSATEALTFLSVGTPTGLPPIATLDGVSLVAVPEPASLALLSFGLLGVYAVRRHTVRKPA